MRLPRGAVLLNRAADPSSPASGELALYPKADALFTKNSAGLVKRISTGSDWTSFTPELVTVSDDDIPGEAVQPNLGSTGTKYGRYRIIDKDIKIQIRLQFGGSGVSAGIGNYNVSLPSGLEMVTDGADPLGYGYAYHTGAGSVHADAKVRFIMPCGFTSTLLTLFLSTETLNFHHVRHNNPWDWADGNANFMRLVIEGELV